MAFGYPAKAGMTVNMTTLPKEIRILSFHHSPAFPTIVCSRCTIDSIPRYDYTRPLQPTIKLRAKVSKQQDPNPHNRLEHTRQTGTSQTGTSCIHDAEDRSQSTDGQPE